MLYYKSISELPIYNWEKCSDGEIEYIRLVKCDTPISDEDHTAWNDIQFEYMEKLGVDKKLLNITIKKRELILVKLEYLQTNERRLLNQITDLEEEIAVMMKPQEGQDNNIDKALIYLNKEFHCGFDKHKITTLHFYLMLKEYGKKNN